MRFGGWRGEWAGVGSTWHPGLFLLNPHCSLQFMSREASFLLGLVVFSLWLLQPVPTKMLSLLP